MTKEQLLVLAKQYFDYDEKREEIFATADKHFFNTEHDAKSYCKGEIEYHHITRIDFDIEQRKKKEKEAEDKKAQIAKEKKEFDEEIQLQDEIKAEEKKKTQKKKLDGRNNNK